MKILLDTHALIWFLEGDRQLSQSARNAIEDDANAKLVSLVSLWEMAIKMSLGKLQLRLPLAEVYQAISNNGFEILPIKFEHILQVAQLPFYHRDPFDRLLVSQALAEAISMCGQDNNFIKYGVKLIW